MPKLLATTPRHGEFEFEIVNEVEGGNIIDG